MAWTDLARFACLVFTGWHVGGAAISVRDGDPPVMIFRHVVLAALGLGAAILISAASA